MSFDHQFYILFLIGRWLETTLPESVGSNLGLESLKIKWLDQNTNELRNIRLYGCIYISAARSPFYQLHLLLTILFFFGGLGEDVSDPPPLWTNRWPPHHFPNDFSFNAIALWTRQNAMLLIPAKLVLKWKSVEFKVL